ncbi:HugZ family pyridoxamine 5'-phosphate oxidase [Ancylobacter radicis]|uniref:Pyridoxamine 5'-phosphate oxidase family protein n=1 Tax=Ancylobacter radicis TaxID=2836179 RepID=A0ABS5R5B0_9HYPH|nr:pyridoxamine 5'-phosphate oxidase family protein [Ancylobacter radicis]MBS9476843.1 pyridoxamine 5'-phosphate oxidase family protein [Ancylobacter radicis]
MPPSTTFDAPAATRRLMREARFGALATLDADGGPYASLVQVATLPDGTPILLLSDLARHTRNVARDRRVSLLVDERRTGDELQGARAGLIGWTVRLSQADEVEIARRRFLARHPDAAGFAGFADFAFYRVEVSSAHLVAGFGRITDVTRDDLILDISDAGEVLAAEESTVAHMNEDHRDAIELYAMQLIGTGPGDWRLIGIDPAGCDLMSGTEVRRLDFPRRATNARIMREILVELAAKARGAPVDSPQ